MKAYFLSTSRIGQISGSATDSDKALHDPQGWELPNDTASWNARGFDIGANTEHVVAGAEQKSRIYFFFGDVVRANSLSDPLNNSHLTAWTDDENSFGGIRLNPVLQRPPQDTSVYWPFEADPPVGITLTNEPASAAFSYGGRVYVFVGAGEAHWCGQTRRDNPPPDLYLVSTDAPDQPNRYRVEFLFDPRLGVCPADAGSHDVRGFRFMLTKAGGPTQQAQWRRCAKCESLFQVSRSRPVPMLSPSSGGVCAAGASHESAPDFEALVVPHGIAEDALHQGKWRLCGQCDAMYFDGYLPNRGVCPAITGFAERVVHPGHKPSDETVYVLAHDQVEDSNHQENWRLCLRCLALFWDGSWQKGRCALPGPENERPVHNALYDIPGSQNESVLAREFILTHDGGGASGQANWRFCVNCYGLFFEGENLKSVCPEGGAHTSLAGPTFVPSVDWLASYFHPPVASRENTEERGVMFNGVTYLGYDFTLPGDTSENRKHEENWQHCKKCGVLFLPSQGSFGICPVGLDSHEGLQSFSLPHRLQEKDVHGDGEWRFCTKCYGLVSTKAGRKFWTVAAAVVNNADFPGLPRDTGDGLIILGYGFDDFYLAWLPLGSSGPALQDTLYLTTPTVGLASSRHDPQLKQMWDPNVEKAFGLFHAHDLADANHFSMAWVEKARCWILLYARQPVPDGSADGAVFARVGANPWSWGEEIPIISRDITPKLYEWVKQNTSPYGPSIINRSAGGFTEWHESTRELKICYLISLNRGYQVHLMQSTVRLSMDMIEEIRSASRG